MKNYWDDYPVRMRQVLLQLTLRILRCEGSIPHNLWCNSCLQTEDRIDELCCRWRELALGEDVWSVIYAGSGNSVYYNHTKPPRFSNDNFYDTEE
jgi:hypothetical protein